MYLMPKPYNARIEFMDIPRIFQYNSMTKAVRSTLLLVLSISSFSLLGQSLYQETFKVKQILDGYHAPSLELSDPSQVELSWQGEKVATDTILPLDRMGRYELKLAPGVSPGVQIELSLDWMEEKETTLSLGAKPIFIYHLPDAVKWNDNTGNGQLVKDPYYDLMAILGLHLAYKDTSFNYSTIEQIYEKYKENPFLAGPLYKFLFDYDLRAVAGNMSFDSKRFSDEIKTNLEENYAWLKELYFESGEDFKKRVLQQRDETYYQKLEIEDKASQNKLAIAATTANAEYAKVSGINSTVIIEGLSDFIVERAQEELNIAFMDRFKQRMIDGVPNEYSTLFPRSYDLFLQFEISNYKKLLQNARPSFFSDLQNVGLNLPKLLSLDKYKGILDFSPAIYNLALFYNMSQLIYTDHTIDQILPFAFHHLTDRNQDLADIVNLKIASTIEDTTKRVAQFRADLPKLQDGIREYCAEAANNYQMITATHNGLIKEIQNLDGMIGEEAPDLKKDLETAKASLQEGWQPLSELEYYIPGQRPQKVFEFYPKYAIANLSGKGYFGDQLKDPDPQLSKVEDYFNERLTGKAYIARGLELTRLLLKESFDERFDSERQVLSSALPLIRSVKEKALLLKKNELGNRVAAIQELQSILSGTLGTVISAWQKAGISEENDVDLAALVYIQRILRNENKSQEIWTNLEIIARALQANMQPSDFDPVLTPTKVRSYLEQADEQLLELDQQLKERIELLKKNHPQTQVQSGDLSAFRTRKANQALLDPSNFTELDQLSSTLKDVGKINERLSSQYKQIQGTIARFDTTYCRPSLSRSRDNALNLGGVLEITTHLLYSFRKEKKTITRPTISPLASKQEENAEVWLDPSAYEELMRDELTRSIYLGLLYEQLNALNGTQHFSKEGIATLSTQLINTIYEIKDGKEKIANKKKFEYKVNFEDYYPMIKSTVDLVSGVVETPIFNGKSLSDLEPALGTIAKVSSEGLSLYQNINNQEYGFAIYNAMELFRVISDAQIDKEREKRRGIVQNLQAKKKVRKQQARNERIRNSILLYGTFMADVLNATNSDQVKGALRAAAAPPGSSRLKRDLVFNLGINSYLGIAAGREKLLNPLEGSKVTATTLGLSVPVGLALSWKFRDTDRASYTLFLSVLDIGAVTSYRLNDTLASALPKLDFENFLAPGASFIYNFNKVPISMGVGWQLGPQTRKIDPLQPDLTSQASRFMFSLNVDVPLFNLMNGKRSAYAERKKKSKKKKPRT